MLRFGFPPLLRNCGSRLFPTLAPMVNIRAGTTAEATRDSGEWIFVDPGFASSAKSCGLLLQDQEPICVSFSELQLQLVRQVRASELPLNLAIEAPLSVAFGKEGNPVGRSVERRDRQARYWYVGLGCSVLVSATYLVRAITEAIPTREVRLFEGLVSFKTREKPSDHRADVQSLKNVVWGFAGCGRIISPDELAASPQDKVVSAFHVAGMSYGVPPVISVGA
ncbi:hypothetical protein NQT62_02190 [Limnobacter humi]|uniref:Uncharacterized protein n=1 Tax=Limnobacter humi TaxID=1778671 RepID=A0ABT1WCK3_9BURK|nr:hypothetical protein [Limnobacter humi]MCQ8895247.1 hypothetical protein [Limnobacter humi]